MQDRSTCRRCSAPLTLYRGAWFGPGDSTACIAGYGQHEPQSTHAFDMLTHLRRQREWSERTFGPGDRTHGVIDHMRKELDEVVQARRDFEVAGLQGDAPADSCDVLSEWVDLVILALDGAWRCGATPEEIIAALVAKQDKNEKRQWPDWRTADPNKAIEHDRTCDDVCTCAPHYAFCKLHPGAE